MKVTKTSTQPAFQPIELKITIESQEELNRLDEICRNSVDVSNVCTDYVGALSYESCVFLDAILNDIGECLSKGFKGTQKPLKSLD